MKLRQALLVGLTFSALMVPAIALSAPAATAPAAPAAREDEPRGAEAAENAANRLGPNVTEHSATFDGHRLAGQATITLATARATALVARPGQITDQELERERGGSGLRYSFDIKSGVKVYEVGVDAKTGKVLENAIEGPTPD